jgi:chloramphenicol-sensitive protein RarD
VWAGALAFTLWGFFPALLPRLPGVFPPEVLANRIVWALLLVAIVLTWQSRWSWLGPALRSRRVMASFVASALLLSANWMTYIWAVSNGHVVEASLGYFITPLDQRRPRLRRARRAAAPRAVDRARRRRGRRRLADGERGRLPWIGLVLGLSFGAYGLLRKVATLGALEGLTLETMILAPAAIARWRGGGAAARPAFRRRRSRPMSGWSASARRRPRPCCSSRSQRGSSR